MSAGAGAQIQPSLAAIREAQKFLAQYFAETRLIAGPFLSQRTAKNVYLKLETELPTASFKVRGAFYALAQRMKKEAVREVIASSTGNHGAAVAYAAKEFGIAARIFLPANCNPVKRGRIAALGAALVESGGGDLASAFRLAAEYAKQPGVYFLNDATDLDLPAGPATIACEILEQLPKGQRNRGADGRYGADSRDCCGGEAGCAAGEDYWRASGARAGVLPVVETRTSCWHRNL